MAELLLVSGQVSYWKARKEVQKSESWLRLKYRLSREEGALSGILDLEREHKAKMENYASDSSSSSETEAAGNLDVRIQLQQKDQEINRLRRELAQAQAGALSAKDPT